MPLHERSCDHACDDHSCNTAAAYVGRLSVHAHTKRLSSIARVPTKPPSLSLGGGGGKLGSFAAAAAATATVPRRQANLLLSGEYTY